MFDSERSGEQVVVRRSQLDRGRRMAEHRLMPQWSPRARSLLVALLLAVIVAGSGSASGAAPGVVALTAGLTAVVSLIVDERRRRTGARGR